MQGVHIIICPHHLPLFFIIYKLYEKLHKNNYFTGNLSVRHSTFMVWSEKYGLSCFCL
jgi:hypothetical protein